VSHEFRFQRILIVDEFMGSVFHIPPPISLPWLAAHLVLSAPHWFNYYLGKGEKPEAKSEAEDLLTFSLPKQANTRRQRDLLVLQQLVDEWEKKKAMGSERQLLDEQKKMHAEMLMTQEVTFKLNQKMTDLSTKIGDLLGTSADMAASMSGDAALTSQVKILRRASQALLPTDDDLTADPATTRLQEALKTARSEAQEAKEKLQERDSRLHKNARSKHPLYPERFKVPDEKVEWSVKWEDYKPIEYTAQVVFDFDRDVRPGGWADPKEPTGVPPNEWNNRHSYEGELVFNRTGRPRNPRGRTGMSGRGLLGKWGANHAADPIVTRYDPAGPSGKDGGPRKLQMVAIRRRDTGEWAIPGGMVDAGEAVSLTVKREFKEEAGNLRDEGERERFNKLTDELFKQDTVVYLGYVDDPRNTDHAWMETTAYHFHCPDEFGGMLPLASGDDAAAVMWLNVDAGEQKYAKLYADHKVWVDRVQENLKNRPPPQPQNPPPPLSHQGSGSGGGGGGGVKVKRTSVSADI
jgi:ADP-ribose pyrophosphatase